MFHNYIIHMYIVTYTRHHNPLLITNRSQILTMYKGRIFEKTSLKNVFDLQEVGKNFTNRGLKWNAYGIRNQKINENSYWHN